MSNADNKDRCQHLKSTIGCEILVQDVMTTDVITVLKFENIMKVAKILSEKNISGLPVVDKERRVIGMITQADILSMVGMRKEHSFKDLLKHMLGEQLPEQKTGDIVGDIMVSPAITIKRDMNIAEAARLMDEKRIRRLVVVDDNGLLEGIVSRADMLKAVLKKLQ